MADNPQKNDMDPQEDSDMGQMGGTSSQSGQKGGQARTDYSQDDMGNTDTKSESSTSLGDEDL